MKGLFFGRASELSTYRELRSDRSRHLNLETIKALSAGYNHTSHERKSIGGAPSRCFGPECGNPTTGVSKPGAESLEGWSAVGGRDKRQATSFLHVALLVIRGAGTHLI